MDHVKETIDDDSVDIQIRDDVQSIGSRVSAFAADPVGNLTPALLVFGLVQKHIVTGLTFGAVKG